MTWFRVGGAGIPAALKNAMNAVFNKKFGTTGQNYPPKQWPDDVNLLGPLPEGTATGSIATFSDGADDVPIKSCEVEIAPTLTGKSAIECQNSNGGNFYNLANGRQLNLELPKGTTIYCKTESPSSYIKVYMRAKGASTSTVIFDIVASMDVRSYTLPDDIEYLTMTENNYNVLVNGGYKIMISLESDGDYTPYTAPTVSTVNLGRTIYGGTVDVVKGEGSEGYKKITLSSNLNDLTMAQIGTTGVYRVRFNLSDAKGAANTSVFSGLCDYYTPASANQTYAQTEGIAINTSGQCFIYDSRFNASTSLNDFKTWIDSNSVNLVYELAAPTDFTFTGQEINTRLGYNAFWSDEGDTEVTYRADISLALQAVSGSRGLMMASRPVTQLIGEQADLDQVNELNEEAENTEEQEGEDNAR